MFDFEKAAHLVEECDLSRVEGVVTKVGELSLEARLTGARLGDAVTVRSANTNAVQAEVIKCHGESIVLVPFGSTSGLGTSGSCSESL